MEPITSDQITQARSAAQAQGQQAVEFAAGGNTLADELRKAVGERFAQSPIAGEVATARSNFLDAAPQARARIADIVSGGQALLPTQQRQILSADRAAALVPLIAGNIKQEAAFGNMGDIISAGLNSYNAEAQRKSGLAQLAQGSYSDLLTNFFKQLEEGRASAAEQRTTELFPLQKQQLLANIAATNRSNIEGATGGEGGNITELANYVIDTDVNGNVAINLEKLDQITNAGVRNQVISLANKQVREKTAENRRVDELNKQQLEANSFWNKNVIPSINGAGSSIMNFLGGVGNQLRRPADAYMRYANWIKNL